MAVMLNEELVKIVVLDLINVFAPWGRAKAVTFGNQEWYWYFLYSAERCLVSLLF